MCWQISRTFLQPQMKPNWLRRAKGLRGVFSTELATKIRQKMERNREQEIAMAMGACCGYNDESGYSNMDLRAAFGKGARWADAHPASYPIWDNDTMLGDVVRSWGEDEQKRMMIEECAELVDALSKEHRGRVCDVVGELADVQIMLWQMMCVYGKDKVNTAISKKMARLRDRLVLWKEKHEYEMG